MLHRFSISCNWALRQRNLLSFVGLVAVISLVLRSNFEKTSRGETTSIPNNYNTPRSVIAVIGTPRTGTVGLYRSFIDSWKCTNNVIDVPFYSSPGYCPDDRTVLRVQSAVSGAKLIRQHRQKHPGGQCLVVTAIRSPASWIPSLYLKYLYFHQSWMCRTEFSSLDWKYMLSGYRRFLTDSDVIAQSAESCLPRLMEEFQGGSVGEQTDRMDFMGGYSVLGPAPEQSEFAGCELLFLRMEQSDRWPDIIPNFVPIERGGWWPGIIQTVLPELRYKRTKSQSSKCPGIARHIKALQDYELTTEERMLVSTYGGGIMADWFDAYGYI